ncbi:MAG TPA: sulfur oxidation c-type cytochrome SoxX [Albitalea sp.]|nr:sulfur oxidation c-type cytochrome SoxX [Albitalea sp.]
MTPRSKMTVAAGAVLALIAVAAGCASAPDARDADRAAAQMIRNSFRAQGPATLARLDQDPIQQACSGTEALPEALAKKLQDEQMATIRWPADGKFLGDWKQGEALAQNGRGMTWSDPAGQPAGGNCYNCHQIGKQEISFGTIGPSLYNYGKLRGVADPASPASAEIVKYTWGKIWNAKAYNACSSMPRFGHAGALSEAQVRDLMALLLDPKSPVNQ